MFLAQHSLPASVDLPHFGHLYLRYYIGWHLVPALIVKLSHSQSPTVAVSIWTTLGVFLFFSLLPDILKKRAAIIAAPLAFIFFGGADIVGTAITHFEEEPLYHFEWWAGWAQFSSNTTAIFWSPQQALPAWLAIAVLMHCRQRPALLPFGALLTSATLLWSPFATIGLVPYYFVLYLRHGLRKVILGWRPVSSLLLLALPVGLYLISSAAVVPHGFIWLEPYTGDGPCFTWPAYFIFLIIEVGAPLLVLFSRRRTEGGFLVAAATTLCLIPLYKMGIANDFAMRASLPSLAVLAILCARLFADSPPWPTIALAVLLLALPGVTGELVRGFLVPQPPVIDLQAADEPMRWWIDQTFAPPPIWVLR